MSKKVQLALVAFGLVFAAGTLVVMVAVIGGLGADTGLEQIPASRVAGTMGSFGIGWGLESQVMRVEEAEEDAVFVGGPSQWYRLAVRPENAGAIREAVEGHFDHQAGGNGGASVVTGDAAGRRMREVGQQARRPKWWEPEKLPDAEPVAIEGPHEHDLFVFSKKTGIVYLFVQGH